MIDKLQQAEMFHKLVEAAKVIDLTVLLSKDYPAASAVGQPFCHFLSDFYDSPGTLDIGPYYDFTIILNEHTGTHCDAPIHMIPDIDKWPHIPHAGETGRITMDKVPILQTIGPADVIDCTALPGTTGSGISPEITVQHIQDWEQIHGSIEREDIVLLYTGWTNLYYKKFPEGFKLERDCRYYKTFPGYPAPNGETVEYLVGKGVKHIGVDTASAGLIQDDNMPHWKALEKGVILTEKLCNLDLLPPKGAYYFFCGLKIEGGSGSPGRAFALIW